MVYRLAALVSALVIAVAPVQAAVTTFSGSGVIDTKAGPLPASRLTPIGSAFAFSFDFDVANAVPFSTGSDESIFDLPVSNFSATLGSYGFSLASEPRYVSFVVIDRGYPDFGTQTSDPVLFYTFYFSSALTDGGSPSTPFQLASGSRVFLTISAAFGTDTGTDVLGLDRLSDAAGATDRSFRYAARDVVTRKSGYLQGRYSGAFTANATVPEASVWTMMIIGFGAAGVALRRRQGVGSSL